DAVGRRAGGQLHAQRAVAIGRLGLVQHRAQVFFLGQRALDGGHATAMAIGAVELDRRPRIERPVDGLERGGLLVLRADRYDLAGAIDVIEALISDDGRLAVFVHDLLYHLGPGWLLVLREGQVSRHEKRTVRARRRGKAGRKHFTGLLRTGGGRERQRRDVADGRAAEFLLLDI